MSKSNGQQIFYEKNPNISFNGIRNTEVFENNKNQFDKIQSKEINNIHIQKPFEQKNVNEIIKPNQGHQFNSLNVEKIQNVEIPRQKLVVDDEQEIKTKVELTERDLKHEIAKQNFVEMTAEQEKIRKSIVTKKVDIPTPATTIPVEKKTFFVPFGKK